MAETAKGMDRKPNYIPEEEDELRLPPELKGRLANFILRLQQKRPSFSYETTASSSSTDLAIKQLEESMDRVETFIEELTTKCAQLEAQNILVSVQQLDLLARGISWLLSLMALFVYGLLALNLTSRLHELLRGWIIGDYEGHNPSMFLWIIAITCQLVVKILLRCALLVLPYLYNEYTHGSAHRRFQVFAIAFIVIGRVRLCRWREQLFIQNNAELNKVDLKEDLNATEKKDAKPSDKKVPRYGEGITEEALWEANYEVSARFLYVSILRLRGLWTKTAQYLSSRADFMPSSYVRELKRLQDEAPATDWEEVEAMLPPSVLESLTDIEKKPLASASIGQVHAARIKATGQKVVIKVQHPHARSLILDDLWSLGVILRIVSWMEPDYEFLEILMKEWAKEVSKELDFTIEAQNLKDARSAIEKLWDGPDTVQYTRATSQSPTAVSFQVEIPVPLDNLCNNQVLVMSFCEGVRVDDFDQLQTWGLNKHAVLDGISQAFAHMMYVTDIFNGDPHPGNLLVRPGTLAKTTSTGDGSFTIVLLDWGLAKRLSETKRLAFCELVTAAATFDYGLMMDSHRHIGLQLKQENASLDMENLRFFLRDMAPRDVARRRIKHKLRKDEAYRQTLKKEERVPMKSKAYPGELFFFVRVNELLHGLGSKFDVDMAYLDLLRPYAERGLRQSASVTDDAVPRLVNGTSSGLDGALEAKMSACFRALEKEGNLVGAQFHVVDKDGKSLASVVAGTLGGLKSHIPMDNHCLVLGFSCTKAVASTMAHIMVKEGYLTYDEPLSRRVWPAFCPTENPPAGLETALELDPEDLRMRWHWKRQISLWHVLTHQAGMWSALPAKLSVKLVADCEACVAAFEYNGQCPEDTLLPSYAPGTKSEYHYMSFGWLVAGALCGAYAQKHGFKSVSFEAVYKAVLAPRLSDKTKQSGFRPCGGSGGFKLANTVTNDISASKLLQKRRESLAIGENDGVDEAVFDRLKSYRGKEFLLDPRIWNCTTAIEANTPAAGGRFSAAGLAHFYRELGTGCILDREIINDVSSLLIEDTGLAGLQGATSTSSNDDDGENRTSWGCGYQLIRFDRDNDRHPSSFGHAGVGGSIGFYHKPTGLSVGLMLNKADGGRDVTMRVLRVFADHFGL